MTKKNEEKFSRQLLFKYLKLGGVVVLALFFIEVWIVNHLSSHGQKIYELKLVKAQLELENQALENKLSEESALVKLDQKAGQLGFAKIKKIEYLPIENVALAK